MDEGHTVFVRRHGFLSSLVLGVCGMVSISVICATAVGLYGLYIVDDKIEDFVGSSPDLIEALSDWQQTLPPALTDAINDRRDLSYIPKVDATIELLGEDSRSTTPVVEVVNRGDKVITLLSMRVTVEDDEGIPTREMTVYAATPLSIDSDWRGPLLPGSKRRFAVRSSRLGRDAAVASLEITELRVWQGEGTPGAIGQQASDEIELGDVEEDQTSEAEPQEAEPQEAEPAESEANIQVKDTERPNAIESSDE